MAISRLIKLLTEATESFHAESKIVSDILAEASKEDVARVNDILSSKYATSKEGNLTVFKPKDTIRSEATATSIQKQAVAGKTGINLGNVPDPQSKIGADLNTSSHVAPVVIPEHLRQELPKLNNTKKVLSTSIRDDHWTTLPEDVTFENKKLGRIDTGIWGDVNKSAGDMSNDLVTRPSLNKFEEDRMNQVYGQLTKDIEKGLSKQELEEYNYFIDLHNEKGIAEKVVNEGFDIDGVVKPASRKVQDAVLARREMLDHAYWIKNHSAIRQARKDGGKLLDDQVIIKPARQNEVRLGEPVGDMVWTKDLKDQGYRLWRMDRKGQTTYTILSQADEASRITDITNDFRLLAYRNGYSPRRYTQPWAITKLGIDEEGRVITSRIATARSRRSAEKAVDRVAGQEPNVAYFAHRSYDDGMDVAMENDMPHLIDNFSSQELEDLQKSLTGLGFADKDINRLLKFKNFFSHKRDTTMMRRGQRLIDADTLGTEKPGFAAVLPNDQALAAHMQKTANYAAHAEFFKTLEDAFIEEFGGFIPKGGQWFDPINISQRVQNGRSAREAYAVQAQLKRIESRLSTFDSIVDRYVIDAADTLMRSKVGKNIEKVADNISKHFGFDLDIPSVSQVVGGIKAFGAIAKLGLLNVSQLPMQSTAFLNVLGYSGPHAVKAGGNLVSVFMAPRLGLRRTKGAEELYKLITDSGFISGFDFVTISDMARGKEKFANSRFLKKLYDKNLIAYQLGEGAVRASAWFAEHHKMIDAIKKGKSKYSTQDVGSRQYLDDISSRAMKPALNMSRMNQPLISRGLLGMPFQFQQFVIQQANFMFGEMGTLQRLGVFGAWVGAFGMEGVPFLMDALIMSEEVASSVAGPEAYGWWQRTVDDFAGKAGELFEDTLFDFVDKNTVKDYFYGGALPAVTEGQISFAHRAGMAKYLSEFFRSAPLDDTLFGPAYQVANTIVGNTIDNMKDTWKIITSEEKFTTNWVLNAASKQVEGLTGPSNVMEAIEAANRGELRDKQLRLITDDPTLGELMGLGLGLGIQEQQRRYERIFSAKDRAKRITDWMNDKAKEIAKQSIDNPTLAQTLMHEKMLQITQYNPTLANTFLMKVSREVVARRAPADARELQSNLMRYSKSFSTPEFESILEQMNR